MKTKNKNFTKFLFSLYKPVKFSVIIMIVAMIICQIFALFKQYILKDIIDLPSKTNFEIKSLYVLLGALIISITLEIVFFYVSNISRNITVYRKQRPYITQKLFNNISRKSYSYFSDNHSGKISAAINQISDITESLNTQMTTSFISPFSAMLTSLIMLISIDIVLFACALAFFAGLIIIRIIFFSKYFNPLVKQATELDRDYNGVLTDSIANFTPIKISGAIKTFANNLKSTRKSSCDLIAKAHKREFFFGGVANILYIILFGLLTWYSVIQYQATEISLGGMVFFIQAMISLKGNSTNLSWAYIGISQNLVILKNSYELLYEGNNVIDDTLPDIKINSGNMTFDNVTFKYTEKNILDNFTLEIKDKQKIGLIGVSGSGKTTISNLIFKFFQPQCGKILIDGKDISKYNSASLYQYVTYAQQETILLHTTLKENIKLVKTDATDEEIIAAAKKANIHDFISKLDDGYDTVVGERGIKLSGGQRQRVALARIFLKNSKIVIFDEATSSLDNDTEFKIQKNISKYFKKQTVICIAHRLTTLKDMDIIYLLKDGKISDQGTPEEIIPKYQVIKDDTKS